MPVTIENEILSAVITPEEGAGMLAFFAKKNGQLLPIMPDARKEESLTWCNWMMLPYSNRIENGKFTFEGKEYTLRNGENNAIHGDTRTRQWCVEDQTETYIRCEFRSDAHDDFNWPWQIEARGEYEIMGNVFSQRVWLWNRSDSRMPAGLGYHPYFSRSLTKPGEPALVQMNVFGVYPDANDNRIPSGPAQPPIPEIDFSTEKAIPTDYGYDFCANGYDGGGTIRWPESGVKLTFKCSPEMTHLVEYNPLQYPYFAVEPVANATNGVNLLANGDPTSGIVVLEPGECLEARFDIVVEIDN
jgi:aldose 1-epimerase